MTPDRRPRAGGRRCGAGPRQGAAIPAGWIRSASFAASLLFVAGCGEVRNAVDTVSIDTIAGVVYVSNPADAPVWRAKEFVRIGATETALGEPRPDEFGRIENLAVGPEGGIFVADAYAGVVRVFAPDGEHLRTIGRKGGGPGEIEDLQGIGVVGDTLVVLDSGNGRVGLFSPDGDWEGQLPWLALSGSSIGVFPAGPTEGYYLGPAMEPGQRFRAGYVRLTTAGPVDTLLRPVPPADAPLADAPSAYITCRFDGGRAIGYYDIPFAPRLAYTPGPGGAMAVAWTGRYEVAFLVDGDTTRVVRRAYEEVPTTTEAFEDGLQEYRDALETFGRGDCDPASPDRPEHKPAIVGLLFDQEGRLVVERHIADGTAFDLYDGDGRIRATVPAPPRDDGVPPYFRHDRLYVVERDSVGVQQVVGYRLRAVRGT